MVKLSEDFHNHAPTVWPRTTKFALVTLVERDVLLEGLTVWSVWSIWHTASCGFCHNEKALREMQTLRAACSKAEPKFFAQPQTPFPGAWDGQNLISWRWSLPLPTNPAWWGSMHAISSYHGSRPTSKQTQTHPQTHKPRHKPTDKTNYNTQCRSFASTQCN